MRPSDVETLRAQGVTVNGKAVELPNVTWTVSNSKIAKVDDIVVTADKKGSTQLTAQVGVYKTTIPLEVQVPVSSITVTNSSGNSYIPIGKTIKLKAKVTGYRGNTPNDSKVKWESSDNSVASVNSSGVVTAHRVGSAEITAKSRDGSGKIGYYNVDVTKRVSKITARYKKLYGYKNTSTNLTNYINIPSVSKYAVKWKSSNSSVVSVSGYYAHLKKSGTATMTGSYDGKSVKFKIEVREYAENISISGSDYLTVGRNTILKAKPANKAYNKKVSWSVYSAFDANGDRVSASKIATITRNGKLSAYAAGYVYVRASASDGGGAYTTKRIDISEPVKSIEWSNVTSKSQTVTVGSSILLKTLTKDKYGDIIKGAVTYTSSSSKVASVASRASYDGSNVIYANAKGIAKVKASYGGKSVTYKIKVVQPVSSVTISGASAVAVGNKENYKAIYSPTTANIKKVDWEIIQAYDVNGDPQEDTSRIATIENGTLKAVAEGKVTIRIKAKDGYDAHDTKTVIITKEAGAIELSESNLTIALGKSKKIEYNLFDQNSQEMNDSYIVWKSSNPGVADITNGIITAHKKGSAQITASYAGKRATIKVKVVQPAEDINIVGSAVLTVGKSSTYKVTVLPKTVNNKKVDWMITKAYDAFDDNVPNPDAIATVSSKGVVKAVSSGTIYLRASAQDGYKAEAEIKIKIYGTPDSMVITGRDTLSPNASTTLMATVFDSNMDCIENSKVTWSSGDKKIVKVDSFGKVTALKPGSTTVTAKCGKIKVSYNITVQ